jgi:hypothetical protein
VTLLVALGALGCVAIVGCGASRRTASSKPRVTVLVRTTAAPPATTTYAKPPAPKPKRKPKPKPAPEPRRAPNPGALPQTDQLPPPGTRRFHAEMAALWAGVRRDSVRQALPAFFPEAAYAQLKRIGDPQGDWTGRLVADYGLDLGAAHTLLGSDPASARLADVEVTQSYAHWIPPGVCYNDVGYYEVPNARVVYRQNGELRSFGIASMISWRGVWYVVHLGAVVRSSAGGVVDDPSGGPGASIPSSSC